MANANIFQALIQPQKSVLDYSNEYENAQALRTRNALQSLTLQQQNDQVQQGLAERNALRRIAQTSAGNPDSFLSGLDSSGMAGLMSMADAKRKAIAETGHLQAQTASQNATAAKTSFETQTAKANKAITDIANLSSPQDALASLQAHLSAGDIDQAKYQGVLSTLQPALQDPAQFGKWKRNMVLGIMDAKDRFAATAPKVDMVNTGGSIVPTNTNADAAPVGPVAGAAPIKVTQSPDNIANNATSRANNRDNIAKDLQVAGVAPGGGLDDNTERTAQAIAKGQLPAPAGMALLNPKNQRVLGRVMEINPQYDSTTVEAKKKAAKDFTSGTLGNALRSVSTANAHLDQLGELADAMQNGNTQIINKVGNYFATQTGDPKVTNFDAIKNIVGQEVVKAIVAGGGSAGERDEAAKIFSNASSPAQLKGAIQHYRMVMGAQSANLMEQRRAAGLPDSTLPNYSKGAATANADLHRQAEAILNGGN